MKKFYSLLAAVALTATVNAQTTTNFVFANQGFTNGQALSSGAIDTNLDYSAAQNDASNPPAYFNSGAAARFYYSSNGNGGSFTITPKNGAVISSVTINAVSGNTPTVKYSVNGGTSQTATLTGTTYTVSGLSADASFTIQNANTSSAQLRTTSISVTYTVPTMAVGDATKGKANLVKNTIVSNELIFGASAKVSVYNTAGQIVKTAEVSDNSRLDVSALPKGTYVVTGLVNRQAVSQKVIKK